MAHWQAPNIGATNSSGFTALPSGGRGYLVGTFGTVDYGGNWWSRTAYVAIVAWFRRLYYDDAHADRGYENLQYGFSVRCIQD